MYESLLTTHTLIFRLDDETRQEDTRQDKIEKMFQRETKKMCFDLDECVSKNESICVCAIRLKDELIRDRDELFYYDMSNEFVSTFHVALY